MNKLIQYARNWLAVLVSAVIVGFLLLTAVAMIPKEAILENVTKSSVYLKDSPQTAKTTRLRRDNFTEAVMCAIAANVDDSKPVTSIMRNAYYRLGTPEASFYHHYKNGTSKMRETLYHRYWHGYLVVLRPLLTVTDYQGIRCFNYIVLSIVTLVLLYFVKKRFNTAILLAVIISLLYASVFFVPQCIHFSITFYVAMLGSIAVLECPWSKWGNVWFSSLFVLIGAITSYSDLIATPFIALGLPLTFSLLKMLEKETLLYQVESIIKLSVAWFFGYMGMWAAKWAIYALFIDQGGFASVIEKISERSIGGVPSYCTFERFFSEVFWFIPDIKNVWWCPAVIAFMASIINILICLFISRPEASKKYSVLLIIAAMPFAWLSLMHNHSLIHIFFVHRMWSITLLGVLLFAVLVISNRNNLPKVASSESKDENIEKQ